MKLEGINWQRFGRIMIFIDAANIIYSCKSLGWKIKYKKLHKYFNKRSKLIDIYFYSAKKQGFGKSEKFLQIITDLGFKLKIRELKIFKQIDGSSELKGNIDGELIVDMIDFKDQYDTAILMSGDGDFKYVVNHLRGSDKKVIVISTRKHVSKELVDVASVFLYLDDFKPYWSF